MRAEADEALKLPIKPGTVYYQAPTPTNYRLRRGSDGVVALQGWFDQELCVGGNTYQTYNAGFWRDLPTVEADE